MGAVAAGHTIEALDLSSDRRAVELAVAVAWSVAALAGVLRRTTVDRPGVGRGRWLGIAAAAGKGERDGGGRCERVASGRHFGTLGGLSSFWMHEERSNNMNSRAFC